MCEQCRLPVSELTRVRAEDGRECEVCSQRADWLLTRRSVGLHLCPAHAQELIAEWGEESRAVFGDAGLGFATDFPSIPAGEACGYRLPGTIPGVPGELCGDPASHVQVETDRHAYCDAHRQE